MSEHIKINNVIIKKSEIVTAELFAKDDKQKECIKILLTTGSTWTIWGDLKKNRQRLTDMLTDEKLYKKLSLIEGVIYSTSVGRRPNMAMEIENILNNES